MFRGTNDASGYRYLLLIPFIVSTPVILAIFSEVSNRAVFFLESRRHHIDAFKRFICSDRVGILVRINRRGRIHKTIAILIAGSLCGRGFAGIYRFQRRVIKVPALVIPVPPSGVGLRAGGRLPFAALPAFSPVLFVPYLSGFA